MQELCRERVASERVRLAEQQAQVAAEGGPVVLAAHEAVRHDAAARGAHEADEDVVRHRVCEQLPEE